MSDEEKKAIEELKNKKTDYFMISNLTGKTLLNLIEKQSKEIEELSDKLTEKICKGVEEEILEEYRQTIISKDKEIEELKAISEYREKIIKGLGLKTLPKTITGFRKLIENNDKKWKDKIKAKIEEVDKDENASIPDFIEYAKEYATQKLQSLLEKE